MVTVPVTYPEAVLGADVSVATIDGAPIVVRVPPGTPSGRILRARGAGAGKQAERGDLLVRVEVAIPREISATERQAVEALAKAMGPAPRQHPSRRP